MAEKAGAGADFGQYRGRDAEEVAEVRRPSQVVEVHQHRPRGVGGVGRVDPAAGQVADQICVDGAGGQLTAVGFSAGALGVVQQPGIFSGREVGVQDQAGPLGEPAAAVAVPLAEGGCPAVLPDDGGADRGALGAVPDQGRLALVGQADGGESARVQMGIDERAGDRHADGGEQSRRVVLDPAGLGIARRDLDLGLADRPQAAVVDDGPGARGALVDGEEVVARHGRTPSWSAGVSAVV